MKNFEERAVLKDHTDFVYSVNFSIDGKILASASEDNTIRLWDLNKFQTLSILSAETGRVQSVVFSPDGKFLASAHQDNCIIFWTLAGI
jgi:WD40 repeat protein